MKNSITPAVETVDIASLSPWPNHARVHDPDKLKAIKKSIQDVGLVCPPIVDEHSTILSGHLRCAAYIEMGLETIDVIRVVQLTAPQKTAFVIAANQFPSRGKWNDEVLQLELETLADFSCEIDLTTTGFDIGEIDVRIGQEVEETGEPPIPEPPAEPVTRTGDLIQLGDHLLLCGNSLESAAWQRLMGSDRAQLGIFDPPYNVPIGGHVSSKDHAEFAMASGEMNSPQFVSFLNTAMTRAINCTVDGGLHLIAIDHGHLRELYAACDPIYEEQLNLIVWSKTNSGMGSLYRSRHELFALYKVGTQAHVNNIRLGKYGRARSNVWTYPGANSFGKTRDKDLADHPTVKPTKLISDAILDLSDPGDIVIDGFGGSGTLILAAEQTKRRARVIEIAPGYCDVAVRRWEEMTGRKAVLLERAGHETPLALPAPTQLLLPPPLNGVAS